MMSALERERQTLRKMVGIYCRGAHRTAQGLCDACRDLLAYAEHRLERCPHREKKPACKDCAIHCYAPDRQRAIQAVMRYAGPRMLLHDPLGALGHLLRRRPNKKGSSS